MKSDCRPTMSGQTKRHTISIRPAPSSRVAATSHSASALCFLLPCIGRDLATSRFTIASPHGDFCAAAPPSTVCRSVVARLVIEHVTSTQARRKARHTSCAVPEAKRDGAVEDTRQILVQVGVLLQVVRRCVRVGCCFECCCCCGCCCALR